MSAITLIGLGPGDPNLLTRAAWSLLTQATLVYTPTPDHPALAHLPASSIIPLPSNNSTRLLVKHASANQSGLICALPGHPHDHPLTSDLSATSLNLHSTIVPGISLIDAFCSALELVRSGSALHIIDAVSLPTPSLATPMTDAVPKTTPDLLPPWCVAQGIGPYTPPPATQTCLNTHAPALLWCSAGTCSMYPIQQTLLYHYPSTHTLWLVRLDARGATESIREIALNALAHAPDLDTSTALSLPALSLLDNRRSLDGVEYVVGRLLGPAGCPWDMQQTHQSLRAHLLEETHEVLEALDSGDMAALSEELGDLLVQVLIHSEMARQAEHFDVHHVLEHITTKLIRRHPHVFGSIEVDDAGEVLHNWEQIKAQELAEKGRQRTSVLDGIPAGLPALATTQKLVKKAMRAGFTWRVREEVWAKLREELDELAQACNADQHATTAASRRHLAEELGDVLFVTAALAHWLNLDAESTLREANSKFRRRFLAMEEQVSTQGRSLAALSDTEKLALWNEAKRNTSSDT